MTPRNETLAFKIWCYCTPREWDCTVREIADALDERPMSVRNVAMAKGWHGRLRSSRPDAFHRAEGAMHGVGMCGLEMLA